MTPDPTMAASGGLLPCPFCGSDDITSGHIRDGRRIMCMECVASVSGYAPNAELRARERWNTRTHPSPPSPARGEELEAGALIRDLADELEAELRGRYTVEALSFKSEQRRFERDMDTVVKARAYLASRPPVTTDAGAVTWNDLADAVGDAAPGKAKLTRQECMFIATRVMSRLARAPAEGG